MQFIEHTESCCIISKSITEIITILENGEQIPRECHTTDQMAVAVYERCFKGDFSANKLLPCTCLFWQTWFGGKSLDLDTGEFKSCLCYIVAGGIDLVI